MTMAARMHWRALAPADLAAVGAIANAVHADLFEAPEMLAERQARYPQGAHLLEAAGLPCGYVLSHPWRFGAPPALNSRLGALPPDADSYYVHDLALLPQARRRGAGAAILAMLEAHARDRRFASMSLVAVSGSGGCWARHGFAPETLPALGGQLTGYGPDARFMVKRLG